MPFEPGNNLGGRTKGSANKATSEIREKFQILLENNIEKVQEDLNKLEPEERLKILLSLSKFVVPTLKAMDVKTQIQEPVITINFKD